MSTHDHIQTMTAEAFLALPESNLPHELIEGILFVAPAPELGHQSVTGDVFVFLKLLKIGLAFLSPVDVRIDDENVIQPDVLLLTSDFTAKTANRKYIMGAPDLVVEVLSPGTSRRDRGEKYELYEKHGVLEYWIIEVNERYVEQFVRQGDRFVRGGVFGPEDSFHSPLLNVQVPVAQFFASLDKPR